MFDRKAILYGLALALAIALFFWVVVPALATEECVEVPAPSPITFSKKILGINVTHKWFEVSEGTWKLYKDIDPRGGHEYWVYAGQTVTEVDCPEPEEPTPTPTDSPKGDDKGDYHGSDPLTLKVCEDTKPGNVASVNAVRVDNDSVRVEWSLPINADKVHIVYREIDRPYEHALLGTLNDGNEEIHLLKDNVQYFFSVVGVNGCAVGMWSKEVTATP